MTGNGTPSPVDAYIRGVFDLARESREAREAGVQLPPLRPAALTLARAMLARERFLDGMERLVAAPGVTADEAERAAAGILALAAEGED